MSKSLIIAEKPSVARDIAKALGGFVRHGDYYESEESVLSSSVGHLLTLVNPEDVTRGKWSFNHLPAIPSKGFALEPSDKKSEARLKMLLKLIKRKDVSEIINACDAGREGELIFRYIIEYSKTNKPTRRLWLQSMTQAAIRKAFEQLREDEEMKPLERAARSRAEADWLVGINGTRAMTAFNSKDGGFFKTTIGRVQTPTLTIVCDREEKIRQFKPRSYWEVHGAFKAAEGTYEGLWFDPDFKKDPADPEKKDSRLWDEAAAKAVAEACQGQSGSVTESAKPATQLSPALFDLTTLQREANSKFGFSAKTTLSLAQALYERHKVLTYPRTDSRCLPEDYLGQVKHTLSDIADSSSSLNAEHCAYARQILAENWIKPNKRIFNNAKVSDHFAIIPTQQLPKTLSEAEAKIYDLVVKRFMAVFFPAAEFRVTTRITQVSGHHFRTEGRVLVKPGWLAIYGRDGGSADTLVPVTDHETVETERVELKPLQTKPPAHFTEATLLSAMESAGKLIDDDELRGAMSERGLGTPATRATIIEGLIKEQYLRREGRDLIPSPKARQLMTLLNGLNVNELTSPGLTGEWEQKLKMMEQDKLDRESFMQEIAQITQIIVNRAKEFESDTVPGDYATLRTPCPNCGGVVKENYRRYACTACDFSITKHPGGRTFELQEVETLLRDHELGPLNGFVSRMGRPFSAMLRLVEPGYKLEFDFGQDSADEADTDFSNLEPIAECPLYEGKLYDTGMSYVCDNTDAEGKRFKVGKVILQQEISPEQLQKLVTEGKTDLLENFVSNRTRRKFKAYLVLNKKTGKVDFEFEARAPRKTAATSSGASAKTTASKSAAKSSSKSAANKTAAKKTAAKKAAVRNSAAKKTAAAAKSSAKRAKAKQDDSESVPF